MKKSSIVAVACSILLIGVIGITVRVLPDAIYTHDYSTDDQAYVIKYGNTILTSYGDMTVESSVQNGDGDTLILKYKEPGEKGNNFRRTLNLNHDVATLDGIEYSSVSSWNVFQPALYEKPLDYLMTIFMLR